VPVTRPPPPRGRGYIYWPSWPTDPSIDDIEDELANADVADVPALAQPLQTIEIGALFDEAVARLRDRRAFELPGVLTLAVRQLERRTLELPPGIRAADAALAGKWTITAHCEQVLKNILNALPD
jgi:hypothetical protein